MTRCSTCSAPSPATRAIPTSLEKIDAAKAEYHLDDPLPVRYVEWLGDFVTGDFGVQFSTDGQPPVSDLLKERIPRSLMLLVMAQTFAIVISIPWALWAASKANKPVDRGSTLMTFMLIAMPSFALGVLLKYLFAIKLDLVPAELRRQRPVPRADLRRWSCRR